VFVILAAARPCVCHPCRRPSLCLSSLPPLSFCLSILAAAVLLFVHSCRRLSFCLSFRSAAEESAVNSASCILLTPNKKPVISTEAAHGIIVSKRTGEIRFSSSTVCQPIALFSKLSVYRYSQSQPPDRNRPPNASVY
jgi:hypothetical protein